MKIYEKRLVNHVRISEGTLLVEGWEEQYESEMGIHTEFEYNELQRLDLFEGDIEDFDARNLQQDLSYR